MALASPGVQQQVEKLNRQIKTLINSDLKEICRREGLPVSGVKAALQKRILDRLNEVNISGDTAILQRLENSVNNRGVSPSGYQSYGQDRASSSAYSASSPTMPGGYWPNNGYGHSSRSVGTDGNSIGLDPAAKKTIAPLSFRQSPFYSIVEALTKIVDLPAMTNHRHTVGTQITLNHDQVTRLRSDTSLKICLFCGSDSGLGRYEQLDIAFPSQIEVKVNNDDVKANFKGLKNKPGTTRPADITNFVRKTANYDNSVTITYALTQKDTKPPTANLKQKFSLIAYLVKTTSVGDLTEKIKRRAVISKQKVIDEMITRANDPDIVATSSVMSLKDPISTVRIQIPCRSTICTHNQCFDVASFLQLQEQAPTWTCPVCNKIISFEALVIDQYVQDILAHTSADQVTIEPNGKWSHGDKSAAQSTNGQNQQDDDSDDDLIDITDMRINQVKKEEPLLATPFSRMTAQTPPSTSREASSAPHSQTNKRKRQEVIDLTLSDEDDDDDQPPHRPSKRHAPGTDSAPNPVNTVNGSAAYYTPSPGLPDPRNGHPYRNSFSSHTSTTPNTATNATFSNNHHSSSNGKINTSSYKPPTINRPPSASVAPFNLSHPRPQQHQSHPPPPSSAFNPSLHLPPPSNGIRRTPSIGSGVAGMRGGGGSYGGGGR